jgi:hypothetical protein
MNIMFSKQTGCCRATAGRYNKGCLDCCTFLSSASLSSEWNPQPTCTATNAILSRKCIHTPSPVPDVHESPICSNKKRTVLFLFFELEDRLEEGGRQLVRPYCPCETCCASCILVTVSTESPHFVPLVDWLALFFFPESQDDLATLRLQHHPFDQQRTDSSTLTNDTSSNVTHNTASTSTVVCR